MVTLIQVIECISCVLGMVILFPPIPYAPEHHMILISYPRLTHKERGQKMYVRNFQRQSINIIKLFIIVICYNGNNLHH